MLSVQEYNDNLMRVLKHTKQNWPNSRVPSLGPLLRPNYPLPDEFHRRRVFGIDNVSDDSFLNGGFNDMLSVMNILEVYGYNLGSVVEWGVGCGRLMRALPAELITNCIGLDVDPVNIEWCSSFMPYGTYGTLEPFGKMPLKDNSVDVLYSYSVMTHLCAVAEIHWLKEINRVLKGTGIISVHGLYSTATIAPWNIHPEFISMWMERGFVESNMNNEDIVDVVPDLYYQDTAHTPEYINRMWSKYINVIDIIPGGFGYHHDAVICKRKG